MQENKSVVIKKRPRKKLMEDTGPLHCKAMKGYHLRWAAINNPQDPVNIQTLLERGFTPVSPKEQGISTEKLGEYASVLSDNSSDTIKRTGRDGITLMLMKLPEDDYLEDLKELKEYNDAQVEQRLRPKPKNDIGLQEFGESVIDGKPVGKK
jgi:hypothetical protein